MSDIARDRLVLAPLVEELVVRAALPVQDERRTLWADHQALRPVPRAPVSVTWEGIPGPQWDAILATGPRAAAHSPDRSRPTCAGACGRRAPSRRPCRVGVPHRARGRIHAARMGIPIAWQEAGRASTIPWKPGGSCPRSPTGSTPRRCASATSKSMSRRRGSPRGGHGAHGRTSRGTRPLADLGHSPFDIAARMCGIENLLVCASRTRCRYRPHDGPDRRAARPPPAARARGPSQLLAFGEFVEIACGCTAGGRRCTITRGSPRRPRSPAPHLADEWAYVSAQTASGLGPDLYERLVQPSNERLAAPYHRRTVYYHGCECLDAKAPIIARIPRCADSTSRPGPRSRRRRPPSRIAWCSRCMPTPAACSSATRARTCGAASLD